MDSILIGSDLAFEGNVSEFFKTGQVEDIFHDLLPEMQESSLTIINLESPFIEKPDPIVKAGIHISGDNSCVKGIVDAGVDVAILANNHILDHGAFGLSNTIRVCKDAGLKTVGAGKNLDEAKEPLHVDVDGLQVLIYAMAEKEFSIATEDGYGANPIDLIDFTRDLMSRKDQYDYIIVVLHAGNEHYQYPRPGLVKMSRFMVEMGANAVICQHTHCVGCVEEYHGAHIVYGQGNFIFETNDPNNPPQWYEGMLVKLEIDKGSSKMNLIPFWQSKGSTGARKMSPNEAQLFMSELKERSKLLNDRQSLQSKWKEFCESKRRYYMSSLFGYRSTMHRINRFGILSRILHSKKSITKTQNIFRCESHREILETLFEKH